MICKSCGANLADNATFCTSCGAPVAAEETIETPAPEAEVQDPGKTFGLIALICGIAGLVLGILAPCLCTCLAALPTIVSAAGIVFGILGMNKSKAVGIENKQAKLGMILAIAGIAVTVIFGIVSAIIMGARGVIGMLTEASSPNYYYY